MHLKLHSQFEVSLAIPPFFGEGVTREHPPPPYFELIV